MRRQRDGYRYLPMEPWLRGPIPGVSPSVAPVLHAFAQAREDLEQHTAGLTTEQIWARPLGLAPVGFQLRHIAGSVDRLMTYLSGTPLDEAKLAELRTEMEPGQSREELLAGVNCALATAEELIRSIDPDSLEEP